MLFRLISGKGPSKQIIEATNYMKVPQFRQVCFCVEHFEKIYRDKEGWIYPGEDFVMFYWYYSPRHFHPWGHCSEVPLCYFWRQVEMGLLGDRVGHWSRLSDCLQLSASSVAWWRQQIETFSSLLAFRVGNLPASDAKHWFFLWSAPEPTVETMETPVILDAIALIMMSL